MSDYIDERRVSTYKNWLTNPCNSSANIALEKAGLTRSSTHNQIVHAARISGAHYRRRGGEITTEAIEVFAGWHKTIYG